MSASAVFIWVVLFVLMLAYTGACVWITVKILRRKK